MRLPAIYSFVRNPGFRIIVRKVAKNLPSKWVMSSKKCRISPQKLSLGSIFSWPQFWQYRPATSVEQLRQLVSFRCFWWDKVYFLFKNKERVYFWENFSLPQTLNLQQSRLSCGKYHIYETSPSFYLLTDRFWNTSTTVLQRHPKYPEHQPETGLLPKKQGQKNPVQ